MKQKSIKDIKCKQCILGLQGLYAMSRHMPDDEYNLDYKCDKCGAEITLKFKEENEVQE